MARISRWSDLVTSLDLTTVLSTPAAAEKSKPLLKPVVLDFSVFAHIDTTGVQNLVDTKKELINGPTPPSNSILLTLSTHDSAALSSVVL